MPGNVYGTFSDLLSLGVILGSMGVRLALIVLGVAGQLDAGTERGRALKSCIDGHSAVSFSGCAVSSAGRAVS
ncbi:hypothetical protein BIV25_31970 [Streptomyces sp. MUSC 14]|nr:hypothetical protein BIV25_31970 [Streptomyces sp. MUSC 14]